VRRILVLIVLLVVGTGSVCDRDANVRPQLYFKDLRPPVGVSVKVLKDVSMNPPEGGNISVDAVVPADIDREEIDRLLRSFYMQAQGRKGFRKGKAERIDIRVYDSEFKARAEGEDWLGQVLQLTQGAEPSFTNRQLPPLLKWAQKALGKQPEYTGKLQPRVLADPTVMSVEVTIPFVEDDGSGTYAKKLTYARATTTFASVVMKLFDEIPKLDRVTFVGKHNDDVVMKIWLTRQQYQELSLRKLEEELGAARGKFMKQLIGGKISERKVQAELGKERRKLYRAAFAKLPDKQVLLVDELR